MITKFNVYEAVHSDSADGLYNIVDKYLHKYPQLGTFDYRMYGWTVDFDKSMFDEPLGTKSVHIVFRNDEGDEWIMYIQDRKPEPPQIVFMTGASNKYKFINLRIQSFETLQEKLRKLGYQTISKL